MKFQSSSIQMRSAVLCASVTDWFDFSNALFNLIFFFFDWNWHWISESDCFARKINNRNYSWSVERLVSCALCAVLSLCFESFIIASHRASISIDQSLNKRNANEFISYVIHDRKSFNWTWINLIVLQSNDIYSYPKLLEHLQN